MNGKMKGLWCWASMFLLACLLFVGALSMKATAAATESIPTIDGYTTEQAHDAGSGYSQLTYSGVSLAQMKSYEQKLLNNGYTLYDQREIQNGTKTNRFATYVKGEMMIHLNLFAPISKFHVIYGPSDKLVPNTQVGNYTAVVTPSVAIIERTDGELCAVVQLADGSYFVIDGGNGYNPTGPRTLPDKNYVDDSGETLTYTRDPKKDMQTLLAYLQDTNRDGKFDSKDTRPKVTWMITHADVDHIHLPYVFMKTYSSKFDLKAVYYNFPNYEEIGLSAANEGKIEELEKYTTEFVSYVNKYFPVAKEYIYHTGQTVDLPGCALEFLYTPEDLYPNNMTSPNHTCGIWRFCFDNGKTFLVTGDAEASTNKQAATAFGSYLQSDILQVIHHGYEGGTKEFYSAVDPDLCLWPCLDISFEHDRRHLGTYSGYNFNAILRNGERTHYATSATHTVFLPSLRYDANGGTGTVAPAGAMYGNNTANEGETPKGTITVATNNFVAPKGKAFFGWATTPDSDVQYSPAEQIEVKTDTVLYAVWKTVVPDLCEHSIEHKEAVAATCYGDGNIEYWYCAACSRMWLDAECTRETDPESVKLSMLETVASIGDVKYGSLEEAAAAAKKTPGADTITLLENVSLSSWIVVDTEVTFVAEKPITISGAQTQTGSMFCAVDGGKLTIQGASKDAKITLVAGVNTTSLVLTNGGEAVLVNVVMVGNENTIYNGNNKARGIFNDGGTVTAKSVEIANMNGDGIYILHDGIVNLDDVTIINSGRYGIKVKGVLNITNEVDASHALTIYGSGNNAIDIENGGKVNSDFWDASQETALIRLIENLKKAIHVRVGGIQKLTNVSTTS